VVLNVLRALKTWQKETTGKIMKFKNKKKRPPTENYVQKTLNFSAIFYFIFRSRGNFNLILLQPPAIVKYFLSFIRNE
jgi:hypothetical protein